MRRWLIGLLLLLVIPTAGTAGDEFIALCFHDVQDTVVTDKVMTLATDRLVALFGWMREHDYRPVSIDDLLAAREGRRPLPEKAVLLTFDDGYASFYSRVYPLLKAFNYPAVLALVGRWMEGKADEKVLYGNRLVPREDFVSWAQVREMAASGLVEVASHSFDLHRGVLANPQGNTEPALSTRIYDPALDAYEDDESYLRRLREDISAAAALIERQTGQRPRVMVWPYGKYNRPAIEMARQAGMPICFTLESGVDNTSNLGEVKRFLVDGNPRLADLVWLLRHPQVKDPRRVVHVDLDYVFDPDPLQQEANLGRLLDRIKDLKITTVYLQAFADPDGDGVADALYFPNRHLPVRADLFNRAAWQLTTRTGVEVYAWMPVLGFVTGDRSLLVQAWDPQTRRGAPDPGAYRRHSPFVRESRRLIAEIYEDLAKHADFQGLLFHDDAYLTDFEDAHPEALARYRAAGLPGDISAIRQDPQLLERWTRLKTQTLVELTEDLAERVRIYRPWVKTARNIFAGPVLQPESEAWFAQNLAVFLRRYDYAAIMAMPYMEDAGDPQAWLQRLVEVVGRYPNGLERTVFELQSVDWRGEGAPLSTETLVEQMRLLQRLGAVNFGYYPDDFLTDHPQMARLHGAISLQSYPYGP